MEDRNLFIEELKTEAVKETLDDLLEQDRDIIVDDFAGGNVDDAYNIGFSNGRTSLAREVLYFLGEEINGRD